VNQITLLRDPHNFFSPGHKMPSWAAFMGVAEAKNQQNTRTQAPHRILGLCSLRASAYGAANGRSEPRQIQE
jgi:hypothetical protein